MEHIEHRMVAVTRKAGMTLIEMMISMGITALMCAGLYSGGIMVHRSMSSLRIKTEAASFAKGGLEEMVAAGMENLATPALPLLNNATDTSSTGASMVRKAHVIWHAADGSVVASMDKDGYAEVHMDIYYPAPLSGKTLVARYATLVK